MPQNFSENHAKQFVVLVGGRGTRLGNLTATTPKPLMQITDNEVFLDFLLRNVARQGFDEILLLAGHLGDAVYNRYHGAVFGTAKVAVLIEPHPMGTGGALNFARDHLHDSFLVANGDTLFDINFRALDQLRQASSDFAAVIALRCVPDVRRFGSVTLDGQTVVGFNEKCDLPEAVEGVINGGIYALDRTVLDFLPEGPSSIENDLFPLLAKAGKLGGIASHGYFLDIGLPETLAIAKQDLPYQRRPAMFLDRDGVINIDSGYVGRIEDFIWVDGAKETIRRANDSGFAVIVVTNQAGVARGFYSEGDVEALHRYIQLQLFNFGAFIDAFYYCPYHADAVTDHYRHANHPDRKPNPGMIQRAIGEHKLSPDQSILIGDQATDIQAAGAVGIRGYLFQGGNLEEFIASIWPDK
ncbi:HAD-IIIA family hydrolase [Asticcacaulis excentricus]|uniref:D,D-heptose 1,7-bisphosphate phosphatase n=1 Tax=Asticcacaulis excentricus (strain ATCC 15261 / DSM 4724 / KCTC 12464 / NCIMB 9791 / VKM B-1370 / CB 48) TaxID=573065 RepID=E8RMQ3_ASTEC|nr:HAD-IIIA family hydrolase [Asticcacaulis excentricus]ADU13934.1 histidinol-phosphate phosphatase family protein [Asticcacaulis excentricus CB 48]